MMEYHLAEETKYESQRDEAFHAIMDLTRGALTAKQQEQLIALYVDATYSSWWAGWHGHGYQIDKVRNKEAVA